MNWGIIYRQPDRTYFSILKAGHCATWQDWLLLWLPVSISLFIFLRAKGRDKKFKSSWIAVLGALFICFAISEADCEPWNSKITGVVIVGISLWQVVASTATLMGRAKGRNKLVRLATGILLGATLVFGLLNHWISSTYFLPASYPQAIADQLLLCNKIVMGEAWNYHETKTVVPLSSLSFDALGEERIPESIRTNGQYKGYQYKLSIDVSNKGSFVLDAVPRTYSPGMLSFHAFPYASPPTIPGYILGSPYTHDWIYEIRMADRSGAPATTTDRTYHRRTLWELVRQWLRKG